MTSGSCVRLRWDERCVFLLQILQMWHWCACSSPLWAVNERVVGKMNNRWGGVMTHFTETRLGGTQSPWHFSTQARHSLPGRLSEISVPRQGDKHALLASGRRTSSRRLLTGRHLMGFEHRTFWLWISSANQWATVDPSCSGWCLRVPDWVKEIMFASQFGWRRCGCLPAWRQVIVPQTQLSRWVSRMYFSVPVWLKGVICLMMFFSPRLNSVFVFASATELRR